MVLVYRDIIRDFELVYGLEDDQPLADGRHAKFLEGFGIEQYEGLAVHVVVYGL